MSNLSLQPNIGSTIEEKLVAVGIDSIEKLRKDGSIGAYNKLQKSGYRCSLNLLFALEGAIMGIRWHKLSRERKLELQSIFEDQSL
ncbi:TfoX/Sxy family protein [bacterium]|nr:TfoX/Sxy family protein [bacterium]